MQPNPREHLGTEVDGHGRKSIELRLPILGSVSFGLYIGNTIKDFISGIGRTKETKLSPAKRPVLISTSRWRHAGGMANSPSEPVQSHLFTEVGRDRK